MRLTKQAPALTCTYITEVHTLIIWINVNVARSEPTGQQLPQVIDHQVEPEVEKPTKKPPTFKS